MKDAVLGEYEFDLSFIYLKDGHELQHQWLALSNPGSKNFNEITGYLKCSLSVVGHADKKVQLEEDPNSDSNAVLMPPQIKPEYFQLRIRFFHAEGLPKMDNFGTIDAFITLMYLGHTLKTHVYTPKKIVDPVIWNQEFLLPTQLPVAANFLTLKVWDEDRASNDIVGSIPLKVTDIMEKDNGLFRWINVYGAHLGHSGPVTDEFNENPEKAPCWKGRILVQFLCEKNENPKLGVADIKDSKTMAESQKYASHQTYDIIAEVSQGVALPSDSKYHVKIKIDEFELKTDKPQV